MLLFPGEVKRKMPSGLPPARSTRTLDVLYNLFYCTSCLKDYGTIYYLGEAGPRMVSEAKRRNLAVILSVSLATT